ncbi:MAG: hypothetical protein HYV02_03680 [Deltaproteobacteria bacterium]|nr:hypothetical protein [Deltaproteobacteria bacterium]
MVMGVLIVSALWHGDGAWGRALSERNEPSFQAAGSETESASDNPFLLRETEKAAVDVKALRLTGIAVSDDASYALVNGRMVHIGDRVGGYRVRQIGLDHLLLQQLDERIIVKLGEGVQ